MLGGGKRLGAFDGGQVGLSQIRRPSPELWHDLGDRINCFTRGLPGGNAGAWLEFGQHLCQVRQFTGLNPIKESLLVGVLRRPRVKVLLPRVSRLGGAVTKTSGVFDDVVLDKEVLITGKIEDVFGASNLVSTDCGAVNRSRVALIWCRPANNGFHDNQRRVLRICLPGLDGFEHGVDVFVVGGLRSKIDLEHLPPVSPVTSCHIFGEGDIGVIFDRNLIRIVENNQ